MRTSLVIVVASLASLLVIDYWLFPSWWGVMVGLGAAAVAVLWSIGAIRKRRQLPGTGPRRAAIGLLAVTVLVIAGIIVVRPVTRLRIALSANDLASEVAAGSLSYTSPIRVGLFDVKSVYADDDHAVFEIDEGDYPVEGARKLLEARVNGARNGTPILSDWTWSIRSH